MTSGAWVESAAEESCSRRTPPRARRDPTLYAPNFMWRLIPKLPAALLLVVAALWALEFHDQRAREKIVRLSLTGPVVSLREGERGTWKLEWPTWPEVKGEPVLCAYGLGYSESGQRPPYELLVRVEPRDAAVLGKARHADADGWFEVGSSTDFDTTARLDRTRARAVEYWVRRADPNEDRFPQLHIEGAEDPIVLEGLLVGAFLRDALATLVGLPLLLWVVVAFVRRRRMQPRDATLAPSA